MIDLFGMVLSGAASWSVGKVLDVVVECFRCSRITQTSIGNGQKNSLGCTNCWQEAVQFTNACDFTVDSTGRVAHAALVFRGGWQVDTDPLNGARYDGWLFFTTAMRAQYLAGKQFVVTGTLSDFDQGQVYSKWAEIYTPNSWDCRWYGPAQRFPIRWDTVPEESRDFRIFALDVILRSRYGDEISRERLLVQPWKS